MQLIVTEDYLSMSRVAARLMADILKQQPAAAVVIATGNTPMQTYQELAQLHQQEKFPVDRLRPFQLDEYLGLAPGDPRSLYDWSVRSFLEPLDIPQERLVRLQADNTDLSAACQAYDAAVRAAGGFELVVLGLGPNGHLGFNEPPADPNSFTHTQELTPASLVSNATYWSPHTVPTQAITCGLKDLLAGRTVLLLVSGAHKREILYKTLCGPITPEVPASYLQEAANVVVISDKAAWPHAIPAHLSR